MRSIGKIAVTLLDRSVSYVTEYWIPIHEATHDIAKGFSLQPLAIGLSACKSSVKSDTKHV
jgi:hypothetical protein